MKRAIPLFMIMMFLTGFAWIPSNPAVLKAKFPGNLHDGASEISVPPTLSSSITEPESIRVAVYDEPNVTTPSYTPAYDLTNNISEVITLLEDEGYQVNSLTLDDIMSHKLTTEHYDVFIMVNNVPRENITNHVKEFWLAGGGVLSFNSAIAYLFSAGMMMPELEADPAGFYWNYKSHDYTNVTNLHPITRDYSVNDTVQLRSNKWTTFWIPMWRDQSSIIEDDVTVLLSNFTEPEYGLGCAIDSSYKGGRVVQLPGDGYSLDSDMEQLIIKSVEYLAPRPKARVAYDLSHNPQLCVDSWDNLARVYDANESYSQLRNAYVNHSYIFDKFYPSSEGNFTSDRLAHYDMMIIAWPNFNLTVAERDALFDWVDEGGSLFLLADRSEFYPHDGMYNINWTIQNLDMHIGMYNVLDEVSATRSDPPHPTTEGCSSIAVGYRSYINLTGPAASPIFDYNGNIVLASQEYGSGRVILSSDLNIFTNKRIKTYDNERLAVNIGDWLTASEADILYMCNYLGTTVYTNPHNSPAALAMNELGLEYQIVYSGSWMNRSLYWQDWDLVIVDAVWALTHYFDELAKHVESGSYLLMSYYLTRAHTSEGLWPLLGFEAASSTYGAPQTSYVYTPDHPIFNMPIDYGANNISDGLDLFYTGEKVSVYDNATALAGYNDTTDSDMASMVLRNDRRTLYNSYLIDLYVNDTDASGYADNYEIWLNQIAFMSAAWIDQPADFTYEAGDPDVDVVWNAGSHAPASYEISVNGTVEENGSWDGSSITFGFGGFDPGVYEVVLTCIDEFGIPSTDAVIATVVDTTAPDLNEPFDFEITEGETAEIEWTAEELYPSQYQVYVNSSLEESGSWEQQDLTITLEDLEVGAYNVSIRCVDESGNEATDTVWVIVNPSTGLIPGIDNQTLLLIVAGLLVLIIIALALRRRKK
ncbi:MAG: LPXTG cell wall anchor domain-containing protein [Candidatus Thorarchaeota archaeon]|nr:LPXTG cell wall anchor domain-containing protein [Candidatus Thorarchaeota archaeon]